MSDDFVLNEIRTKLTVSVPVAGKALCNLGRNASYEAAKLGSIGGIPVIRVGKKEQVATALIRKMLGLEAG